MRTRSSRTFLVLAFLVLAVGAFVAGRSWQRGRSEPEGATAPSPPAGSAAGGRGGMAETGGEPLGGSPESLGPLAPPIADPLEDDPLAGSDNGWAAVDMDAVRAAMPDNLYWQMGVPTKDPEILRQREEERARWNVEYGKVLSNTATEDEVHAYFEYRDRLASDYVEFITHVLENYGESLTLRDVGLLKVAAELNLARLEEIPRQLADALERRKAHAAAREAWLQEQALFQGKANQPAEPDATR